MDLQLRPILYALKIGIILFPLFNILDRFVYPHEAWTFLMIRLGVSALLLIIYFILKNKKGKYTSPLMFTGIFLSTLSITLMCFISKEGFASPYYIGLLQIIIVCSLLFNIRPIVVIWLIIASVAQHFIFLSFLPFLWKDLLINLFGVGVFAFIGLLIQNFIHHLIEEIRSLKGIIPICANCKKIRDDKGYWHQVELYIRSHSEADFSHSLCPDCMKKLYPDLLKTE
jgi:hypothetical protein